MTGKQVKQMLIAEGLIYSGGAWLIMTAGLGVTYYLYQFLNYYRAAFEIPVLPVLAAVVLTLFVCVIVPVIAYRQLDKRSALWSVLKGLIK